MIHKFDPRTMKLPYVQEINEYQEIAHKAREPLIIVEWDVEYAPEVGARMLKRIEAQPDRVHVAPYLTNIYFTTDGLPVLFWVHRMLREGNQKLTMEEGFNKIAPVEWTCECGRPIKRTVNMKLRYPAWVAGGEPEADIACLGFTYLPYEWWVKVYPEIKHIPWNILDIEISARMIKDKMKAVVHWDCVVNHLHVGIRESEKSVFRKWVGIDRNPLTDEEKKWLKVETLPRYHGFLTEPMLADKQTKPALNCPRCGQLNTWEQIAGNDNRCLKCAGEFPPSILYGQVAR